MIPTQSRYPIQVQRELHGYAVVVRVVGEVDTMTVADLTRQADVALALATPPAPVVVDLRGVVFLAAAGLNELHREHLAAEAAGVVLRVVANQRHLLRSFRITGLDAELRPWPNLDEALRVRPGALPLPG